MPYQRNQSFLRLQALFIFPLTCGEWPNCGICWRSSPPWVLGRTPLMWSPTYLDPFQERTEWCVWSTVGKASLGMWLWGDCVGLARGSSLSQWKGLSSWGCGKVGGQMYPVPTLCSTQNPQLMLLLRSKSPSGQRWKKIGYTAGTEKQFLLNSVCRKTKCIWDGPRERYKQMCYFGFTHSSWLNMWYLPTDE